MRCFFWQCILNLPLGHRSYVVRPMPIKLNRNDALHYQTFCSISVVYVHKYIFRCLFSWFLFTFHNFPRFNVTKTEPSECGLFAIWYTNFLLWQQNLLDTSGKLLHYSVRNTRIHSRMKSDVSRKSPTTATTKPNETLWNWWQRACRW